MSVQHISKFATAAVLMLQVILAQAGMTIEKRPSIHAVPMRISVEQTTDTTRISGEIHRYPSSPSRRLYGEARIEGIDLEGKSLFVTYADLSRIGHGKHTARAKFSVAIDNILAENIDVLKIGYVTSGRR
ncbi:MAG: hypothetical protein KZQ76_14850 [Candidatus Thiodiazotropha sp. (ex Epidulcina cf. delphinae)]|nr:hypothetical protein [Candidatus Thiodiazotropha sp. (ex Epidulcina cf. delphinae)]